MLFYPDPEPSGKARERKKKIYGFATSLGKVEKTL
jgi:hypothetical protein